MHGSIFTRCSNLHSNPISYLASLCRTELETGALDGHSCLQPHSWTVRESYSKPGLPSSRAHVPRTGCLAFPGEMGCLDPPTCHGRFQPTTTLHLTRKPGLHPQGLEKGPVCGGTERATLSPGSPASGEQEACSCAQLCPTALGHLQQTLPPLSLGPR